MVVLALCLVRCIFTQLSRSLVHAVYTVHLSSTKVAKPEPRYEGAQTQNPGLEIIVPVWNP